MPIPARLYPQMKRFSLCTLVAAACAPFAAAQTFIPLDADLATSLIGRPSSTATVGRVTVHIIDDSSLSLRNPENHMFKFTHLNQDVSASLGIASFGLSGGQYFENVFVDEWKYTAIRATVKIGSGPERDALALFGYGVRLSFRAQGSDLGVKGGIGSVSLDVKFRKSSDNFMMEAHGFHSFHTIQPEANTDGTVSAKSLGKAMNDAFTAYMADKTQFGAPQFFGLSVSSETALEIAKPIK